MSLIDEAKMLRELEQQATPEKWETDENEGGHEIRMGKAITSRGQYPCHQVIEYEHGCFEDDDNDPPANVQAAEAEANAYLISTLRNLAPAMLEVLGMFRKGDANSMESAINIAKIFPCDQGLEKEYRAMVLGALDRMKTMAALMEKEERQAAMDLAVDRLIGNTDREADAYADWRVSKVLRATLEAGMIISECIFCGEMLTWGKEYRDHMETHQEAMQ